MIKYIVIDSGSDASRLMFLDLKKMKNVTKTSKTFDIKNPVLRIANRIHMSGRINDYLNLPGKAIWNKYSVCEVAKKDVENTYVIIMTNISVRKYTVKYLAQLKTLPNVRMILILVDSCVDKKLYPEEYIKNIEFDCIYSFDERDCQEHGFLKTNSLYSKRTDIRPSERKYDLFFVGRAKDRLESLLSIAKQGYKKNLNCGFYILGVDKEKRIKTPGVFYIDLVLSYDEVLPMVLSSRCLLDIVQNGQEGMTMRVYESIFYDKKLLTNNKSIKSLKYFNDDMKIIEDIDKIDFDFIRKPMPEYNYGGEYSPMNLIKNIRDRVQEECR